MVMKNIQEIVEISFIFLNEENIVNITVTSLKMSLNEYGGRMQRTTF